MLKKENKIQLVVIVLIAAFLLALYGYRLYFPAERYFDEVYHVRRAAQFALEHKYKHNMTTHPPLWHFFSSAWISLYGNYSWVWRIQSAICGLFVVFLVYIISVRIFNNRFLAFLTAFLFTFDGMSITQARIGMLNTMMFMFVLLSLFCFLQFFLDEKWPRKKAFLWAGIFWGMALVTRMVASYLIIIYVVAIGVYLFKSKKDYMPTIRDSLLYLILVPIIIYFGIHLFISFYYNNSWADFWQHQRYAYKSLVLKKGHNYGSPWWSWPFMTRPIWYFYGHNKETGIVEGILCIGNQAIFWIIPISIGYVIWKFTQRRSWAHGLILLGFFGNWLPWAFVTRVKFFHFFYTAMPFACMSIAVLLSRIWQMKKWGRIIVTLYLILVVGLFIYWYPLLTGFPISHEYYKHHMWFRSWI